MGIGATMVYNMYKPVAEGDVRKMNALLNFYRKTYRVIGLIILILGICLIPWLPSLIKGEYPQDISLTGLYLIYLGNTVISYFMFAYMSSLIVVYQGADINSTINSIVSIGLFGSQTAILLITKNYYLFSLLMIVFTILNNLLIVWRTHQLFPQYRAEGKLTSADVSKIKKLVAGTFVQLACAVTRNSLDSICVSAFLGLALTAVYNIYFVVMAGIDVFTNLISTAFQGGVGNHVATKSVEENFQELKKIDFVYLWVSGWFTICLLCMYQPFMRLWMGEEMLLSFSAVI